MAFHNSSIADKFTPAHVTPHDGQTAQVIYPTTKRPKGGYPVLINTSLSGFTTATEFKTYNQLMNVSQSRIAYRWLLAGGALVTAPLTVSRGGTTGNAISDAIYDPPNGKYGAAYSGNGVFLPPGANPGAAAIEPWLDPARHMPQKDVWYLRHWVARNANVHGFDNGRVAYMGSSAGAVSGTYAIYGPDQRVALGLGDVSPSGMAWAGCIAINLPSRFKTMVGTALGFMFPDSGNTPAFNTPAVTLTNADQDFLDELSFLNFDTGSSVPLYLASNDASESANLTPPYSDNLTTSFHGVDFGAMVKLARSTQRFVAWSDLILVTGHEDAVYADAASDDNSLFVINAIDTLSTFLNLDNTAMVDRSIQHVATKYNSTQHAAGLALSEAAYTVIVPAGPHKAIFIQNVTYTDQAAVLRVITNGADATGSSQLGLGLNAPSSTTILMNAPSGLFLHTAGEAVLAKSNALLNKANWQAIIYY